MGMKDVPVGEVWIAPVGTPLETFPEGWRRLGKEVEEDEQ